MVAHRMLGKTQFVGDLPVAEAFDPGSSVPQSVDGILREMYDDGQRSVNVNRACRRKAKSSLWAAPFGGGNMMRMRRRQGIR